MRVYTELERKLELGFIHTITNQNQTILLCLPLTNPVPVDLAVVLCDDSSPTRQGATLPPSPPRPRPPPVSSAAIRRPQLQPRGHGGLLLRAGFGDGLRLSEEARCGRCHGSLLLWAARRVRGWGPAKKVRGAEGSIWRERWV
jgi:hypothetical protein